MNIMIKKIEFWLNVFHYFLYKADYKFHMFSNKINPALLLGKIPSLKRRLEKQGTSQIEIVNKVWTDRRFGFGIMLSGGGLMIFLFQYILTVFDILNFLLNYPFLFSWEPFAVCGCLAYGICHFTVFQKDKYLGYFKKFDKWTQQEKWKHGLWSAAFVIGAIVSFIFSFKILPP